ncbi:MAG: transposase [Thermosynechococcaceae cyanobacterium]
MQTSNPAIWRTRLETYRIELEEGSHHHLRPEHRLRLEIMLRADRGESQKTICAALGCAPGTARFWMKMMQLGEIDAWASAPIGRPQKVSPEYLARLRKLVCHSPKTYGYAAKQWTALYLRQQLIKELGIDVSDRHINRLLNEMHISSPYRHKSSRSAQGKNRSSSITIQDLQPE